MLTKIYNVSKAGARNSKADAERIQGVHDHAVSLGATCSKAEKLSQGGDDLQKAAGASNSKADMQRELGKRFAAAQRGLEKRLSEAHSRRTNKTVEKEATTLDLIKSAQTKPIRMDGLRKL